ncbi:MAG: methyl-accepting chemotaxis protein [Thermoleophilia bacterium]
MLRRALSDSRIRTRLGAILALAAVVTLAVGAIGLQSVRSLRGDIRDYADRTVPAVQATISLGKLADERKALAADHLYVFDGDLKTEDAIQATLKDNGAAIDAELARVERTAGDRHADAVARVSDLTARFTAVVDDAIAKSRQETVTNAEERDGSRGVYTGTIMPLSEDYDAAIAELTTRLRADSTSEAAAADDGAGTSLLLVSLIALAGLALLGVAGRLVTRSITVPVEALRERMFELADGDGDLTRRLDVTGQDEIGQVATAFNRFAATIHDVVRMAGAASGGLAKNATQLLTTASSAGEAVDQMAATVEGVAEAAHQQAESVQEVSRLVEDMEGAIVATAESGRAVAELAADADASASQGESAVEDAHEAMREITAAVNSANDVVSALGERGREIGAIVATIGEISDQTNLLALNAAIEAARAGEQGRGFAVVADQVRKLAEESQQAVGSIAAIIGDIQRETTRAVEAMAGGLGKVEQGGEIVQRAGQTFGIIRRRVAAVTGEVERVAEAAGDLERAAEQVRGRITEVAAVTEETAASTAEISRSAEQTSAGASQVVGVAGEVQDAVTDLQQLVGRFRVWQPDQEDRRKGVRPPEEQGERPRP